MKNLLKSFLTSSLAIITITPIAIVTTACSFVQPTPNRQIVDSHLEFINDIEFSLSGSRVVQGSQVSFSLGTAWVYQALGELTDYKYTMITNYHVYNQIKDCDSFHFGFNEYGSMNRQIQLQEIYMAKIIGLQKENLNPFFIETRAPVLGKSSYLDVCALDISFKQSADQSVRLQTKLDKINKIIKTRADETGLSDKTALGIADNKFGHNNGRVYFAGYPWDTSVPDPQRSYTYFAEWYEDGLQNSDLQLNGFNGLSSEPFNTYQDQYWFESWSVFPLGGGASGSLVVNAKNEAMGIYWGGRGNSSIFTPSCALFYMGNKIGDEPGKKYDIDFFYQLEHRND